MYNIEGLVQAQWFSCKPGELLSPGENKTVHVGKILSK